MKTITTYLRRNDTGVLEVDSANRHVRNVATIVRNEQVQINLCVFDGDSATTTMTREQLTAYGISWHFRIAPQADMQGPICIDAGNDSIDISDTGVISITVITTDTVQSASAIGSATRAIWAAELASIADGAEQPGLVMQWRVAYQNRVSSENASPPDAETSQFYPDEIIDAKFANITDTLGIPTDINELTDHSNLLSDRVAAVSALPTAAVGLVGLTYLLTSDNDNKPAGSQWKCVADGEGYAWQLVATAVQSSSASTLTVYPGQQYAWSVPTGEGTLSASGFPADGMTHSLIKITLPTGSSVVGATGANAVTVVDALEENKINYMAVVSVDGACQLVKTGIAAEDID